jgi:transcriptional regulator
VLTPLLTFCVRGYRLIPFGFNCHQHVNNAGISVPLLSVDLACLMALFRSEETAKEVLQDDLTILIREAGKALLDPRLAASSLDEAISTQLVRAINKVRDKRA